MCKKQVNVTRHQLQFNVAQLLKERTGATRDYDLEIEVKDLFDKDDFQAVSLLTGHLKFMHTGPNILVTGELEVTAQKDCVRCLSDFVVPLNLELEEIFYPAVDIISGTPLTRPEEVDAENYISDQHILNLTEIIRQEILVSGDGIFYCRPECKGLCPHCGQDLNSESCDCQEDQIDARWADLLALKEK